MPTSLSSDSPSPYSLISIIRAWTGGKVQTSEGTPPCLSQTSISILRGSGSPPRDSRSAFPAMYPTETLSHTPPTILMDCFSGDGRMMRMHPGTSVRSKVSAWQSVIPTRFVLMPSMSTSPIMSRLPNCVDRHSPQLRVMPHPRSLWMILTVPCSLLSTYSMRSGVPACSKLLITSITVLPRTRTHRSTRP